MKPRPLQPHHTVEQLETFYRNAEHPVERSRWHILWLRKKGFAVKDIMDVTGFAESTIRELFSGYNKAGEKAVEDKRKHNGAARKLTKEQEGQLGDILKLDDSEGVWTSDRVRVIIEEKFDVKLSNVCAWWYIKRLDDAGQTPRVKRPQAAMEEAKG